MRLSARNTICWLCKMIEITCQLYHTQMKSIYVCKYLLQKSDTNKIVVFAQRLKVVGGNIEYNVFVVMKTTLLNQIPILIWLKHSFFPTVPWCLRVLVRFWLLLVYQRYVVTISYNFSKGKEICFYLVSSSWKLVEINMFYKIFYKRPFTNDNYLQNGVVKQYDYQGIALDTCNSAYNCHSKRKCKGTHCNYVCNKIDLGVI